MMLEGLRGLLEIEFNVVGAGLGVLPFIMDNGYYWV